MTSEIQTDLTIHRIKLHAPAFFPTACTTNVIPLELKTPISPRIMWKIGHQDLAAPLNQQVYLVSINLLHHGEQEVINLVTGFGTTDHCEGTLNYTVCTLRSGIGLYDLEIRDGDILLDDLKPPTLVALANNTAVSHAEEPEGRGHRSTLIDFVEFAFFRWDASIYYWREKVGQTYKQIQMQTGGIGSDQYEVHSTGECVSYLDPREDVLQSLNRLALYAGAAAARHDESFLKDRLDPGLSVNYTMVYQDVVSVFHTDYVWFLIAALVELICICLVAPT